VLLFVSKVNVNAGVVAVDESIVIAAEFYEYCTYVLQIRRTKILKIEK
jgi:hypothetical protein